MTNVPAPLYANAAAMSPAEPATTTASPAVVYPAPDCQPQQQQPMGPTVVPVVPDVVKPSPCRCGGRCGQALCGEAIILGSDDVLASQQAAFAAPDKYAIFRRFPPMIGSDEGISRSLVAHMRCLSPVQQFARAGGFLIFSFILMGIVLNVTTARMPDPTRWPELPDLGAEWTPYMPQLEHVTDLLLWGLNIAVISLFFLLRRVALGRVAPPTRMCHLAQGAFDSQPQLCAALLNGDLVVARRAPGVATAAAGAWEGPAGVWAASAVAAGDAAFDLVPSSTAAANRNACTVDVGAPSPTPGSASVTIADTAPIETAQPLLLGEGPEAREDRQLINRHVAYLFPADDENLHVLAYARLFMTYALSILGRCVVNLATSLPPTNNKCRSEPPHIADGAWNVALTLLSFGSGNIHCGDLLYSGHSICVAVTTCMCWTYGPLVSRLYRPISAALALSTVFTIVASRSHYTDDIIVAWMVTLGLFASIGHHPYGLPRWAQWFLQPLWSMGKDGCCGCSVYSLLDRLAHFLARKIDGLNVI